MAAEGVGIKVLWEDSKSTGAGAAGAVRKLIEIDRAEAIVGDVFGFVTAAMVPVVAGFKVPIVTPALPKSGCELGNGMTFTVASQIPSALPASIELARSIGAKRAAFLTLGDPDWGSQYRAVWQKMASELKIEVVDDTVIPDLVADFRALLPRILAKKPDVIFFAHEPAGVLKALRALRYQGAIVSSNAVLEVLATQSSDRALVEGVYMVDPKMDPAFESAFAKRFGTPPLLEAHASYEAIRAIGRARLSGVVPLSDALKNVSYQGAAGRVDLSDPCRGRVATWVPKQIKSGTVEPLLR